MEIYSKDSMGMFNEKKHINILSDNLQPAQAKRAANSIHRIKSAKS